jgi:hypothetical protein
MEDTHTYVGGIDGMELHIFPDIVADVRYDRFARTWVINGVDVRSAALNLTDPAALDDHIEAELYTYPVVTGLGFTGDRP